MRKDDKWADKEAISLEDIKDKPLIVSKEINNNSQLSEWFNNDIEHLNIVSTYSLLFNATLMVEDQLGYAICLDNLINTTGESQLCFRPLVGAREVSYYFIWKKYQILSKASQYFLDTVKKTIDDFK